VASPRFHLPDHLADGVAAVYACAYFLGLALLTPGSVAAQRVGELAYLPLGLAVAWLYRRNARVPGLDSRTRLAWHLLASGALALWFSGNTWNLWLHFNPQSPYPRWLDHLALGQYLLFVAGYLCFPSQPQPREGRTRNLLDVALTVVAGLMLAFHFGLGVLLRDTPMGSGALNSVLDWALFVIAAVGSTRKRDPIIRTVMGLLFAAACFYLLGNYVLSGMDRYLVGQPVDAFWFAAWVLRWTAGSLAWRRYPMASEGPDPVTEAGFREYRSNAFAYLLVFGAFLLLAVRVLQGEHRHLEVLAVGAVLMAGLLILRQIAEFRENRRLFLAHLAQEARFRSLVQHSSDVFLVVEEAGTLGYVSASAQRVFGEATAVRSGALLADLFHPDDAVQATAWMAEGAPGLLQGRMVDCNGSWRDMEIQASDLRGDPDVGGWVLTCRDATARNELERQFRHAQKLDAVGKLAGGVAHDINNMLAVLMARLELMGLDESLGPRQEGHLRSMEAAVQQSGEIVRKLLAFSRRQVIEPVVLDLNARVEEVRQTLAPLLGEDVALELALDPGLWRVKLDPSQVDQILMNLLLNARDASPQGARISLSTSNLRIGPEPLPAHPSARPGAHVLLAVTDHGTGMSAETQSRIFEPFFTTKPVGKGTGLGLSTVLGIVDQNGGFLDVTSEPGQGSTFRIYFPAVFEAPAAGPLPDPAAASPATGSVLLVEDNDALRDAITAVIQRLGYRVWSAPGAEEAMVLLEEPALHLDLLLTDVIMPGSNGRELRDRALRLRPDLKVLYMSGYTADVIAEKGVLPEGTEFIQKPFTREAIGRKLREALGRPA